MTGPSTIATNRAWLVGCSGMRTGVRFALQDVITRVGRGPGNDIVVEGADAASVSLEHLEIRREGETFRIRDLQSTNGTFVNGERVEEVPLDAPSLIRLGGQGPEFSFVVEAPAAPPLERTLESAAAPTQAAAAPQATFEGLLADAVERARHARARGVPNPTMTVMRDALNTALRTRGRRATRIICALAIVLVAVTGAAAWRIRAIEAQRAAIDRRIATLEKQLSDAAGGTDTDRLASELEIYQGQGEQLRNSVLSRFGPRPREDFVTTQIRLLLAEFGAETYSVPPEFADRVRFYIEGYQGSDRPIMARALGSVAGRIEAIRTIVEQEQLPPDLAYIPVVETAMHSGKSSAAGAAGPWQLTPATARANGLRVDDDVDERESLVKSTLAGCRYLRALILDFGAGSSVMLALAAYNVGPGKVRQAVMNTVRDPIRQRNFWYLYRVRALPQETREYVPKVIAAMIIGRNPAQFGF
jgi:hypothetical protein